MNQAQTTDRPTAAPDTGPASAPPSRPRRPVGTAVALICAGVLWGLHILGVDLRWEVLLPVALIVVGAGVLVGGRSAAAHGLVGFGTLLAVIAVLVLVFPAVPSLDAGDRDVLVTDLDDLEATYDLGAGDLTLDLRGLDLPAGTTAITVRVGVGQLEIRVPADVTVRADTRVGVGQTVVFGRTVGGIAPSREVTEAGVPGAGTLEIEASVGLGQLEVDR